MAAFFDPEKAFDQACTENLRKNASNAALKILAFYVMVVICNLFHHLLRPWSQPRITSDLVVSAPINRKKRLFILPPGVSFRCFLSKSEMIRKKLDLALPNLHLFLFFFSSQNHLK